MPIYEYQCAKCGRVSNFLVRSIATHQPPACPKCGHSKMSRLLSRFTLGRAAPAAAAGAAAEDAGAPPGSGAPPPGAPPGGEPDLPGGDFLDGIDENDPRAMGRALRQMAQEAGEPIDAEMDEVVRRLESGEDPESIEDKMGDALGGPGEGGSDDTLYDG
jgi:putative FmdB family regulatory protein